MSKSKPVNDKYVGVYVKMHPRYADMVKGSQERKGVSQGMYVMKLIDAGDKLVPKVRKPKLAGITFIARPIKKS